MTQHSYVHGASDKPLRYQTIGQCLEEAAVRWGDREALVSAHQEVRLSYRDLNEQSSRIAYGLLAMGLEPGDRVGIWAPNCAEWVLTQYATAKAGLILVNINPAYRTSELTYALNKVECRGLILSSRFKSSDYVAMLKSIAPEIGAGSALDIKSPALPHLQRVMLIGDDAAAGFTPFGGIADFRMPASDARVEALRNSLQPDDPINIQFTSGTTGSPKGATLTHFNILNNGYFAGEALRLQPEDRVCVPVPLYHCFGMVLGNLAAVGHGACVVYPSEAFDPAKVLEAVERERCTALYGVPTMFVAALDHPDFRNFDYSSLRTGIMGGAPCPVEVMRRVEQDMGLEEMTIAYGMTETSPVSFQSATDDPTLCRVETVGRVQPHVEVKIVDLKGRIVPRGDRGELLTRGYLVMRGYWNDKAKTEEAIDRSGWMHTGDLAAIDDEGYCRIVGRIKDMVIRGGENIYPREVEEFLYTHPDIAEVAAFGVPDDKFGEELCVWIQTRGPAALTGADIRDYCRDKIAHYKIPRYVEFVDAFPMTVTGKIQKFIMREKMIATLSGGQRPSA